SEVMYDLPGGDNNREWLEIYNSGNEAIELNAESWRFNDGSNHTLTLTQGSLAIPAGGYAILASDAQTFLDSHAGFTGTVIDTVMSLNNTSDTLKLSSDKGESFFSDTTYENTQGADGDGNSLQFLDGAWIAASETPGASSSAGAPAEEEAPSGEETAPTPAPAPRASGDPKAIKISELFPNPEGDEIQEFIEIWNSGNASVSLEGWKLSDSARVFEITDIILVPNERRVFPRNITGITLNNSSEIVSLFDANGDGIDSYAYEKTIEGSSLALDMHSGKFIWTHTPTPGQANIITLPNDPPTPIITYGHNPVAPGEFTAISGRDSTDPDDDALSYLWKIGPTFQANGPHVSYAFKELGPQLVWVSISDGRHTVVATSTIDVRDPIDVVSFRISQNRQDAVQIQTPAASGAQAGQIYITEIFPNPAGVDDGEWIELYNPNEFAVDLDAWIIDDEDGGSRPHTVLERVIAARSYLVLGKEETNITLNNTSDEVRLFNPNNELIDSMLFDDVQENESYAKSDDGFWFWSEHVTPGEPNTAS
ncbi:MAG: lamin tail domain-containing protein, partial [Patescibacteria group bacterium]|nr:lamin tail domain-containing protein [Patescibacteria group bacterium]